ncbi:MAG: hypothetical protein M3O46_22165 [Myxococcota bacterium]|nr:hypothetical protein [Myxococcota bacterium]
MIALSLCLSLPALAVAFFLDWLKGRLLGFPARLSSSTSAKIAPPVRA